MDSPSNLEPGEFTPSAVINKAFKAKKTKKKQSEFVQRSRMRKKEAISPDKKKEEHLDLPLE